MDPTRNTKSLKLSKTIIGTNKSWLMESTVSIFFKLKNKKWTNKFKSSSKKNKPWKRTSSRNKVLNKKCKYQTLNTWHCLKNLEYKNKGKTKKLYCFKTSWTNYLTSITKWSAFKQLGRPSASFTSNFKLKIDAN